MMRTDDGRIDHLQRGVRHSASREPFQDHVPDATVGPPPKLPKDRVPVAEALRQVAPRCAGSHQPKHRVEHAAMIAWRPAAAAMDQERFEVRPLIVGHQSANQGCPPQRAALNQFAILASIGLSTRPSRQPSTPAPTVSSRSLWGFCWDLFFVQSSVLMGTSTRNISAGNRSRMRAHCLLVSRNSFQIHTRSKATSNVEIGLGTELAGCDLHVVYRTILQIQCCTFLATGFSPQ